MHIVHFAETLMGGPATHLNQLLRFQVKAYESVTVFCPERHAYLIECAGVRVITFPDTKRTLFGFISLCRHWRAHLQTHDYDIIHLHSSFAGAVGRLFASKPKAGIVYCSRGWAFGMNCGMAKKRLYAIAERLLWYRTDAIINISRNEEALANWAGIPPDRSRVIYNGIEDADWTPLPAGHTPRRLLFVGRYDWAKGVDLVVDAMSTLSAQGFKLETIGGWVTDKPPAAKFPDFVTDHGWQGAAGIQRAMQAADVVVVPSRWEGFGFVAAEAARAGRPVVAARVGGLKEIVVDGETGVLCDPDSAQSIVDGVLRLSGLDTRQLGKDGRKRFEALFTANRMFDEIDGVYRDVCEARTIGLRYEARSPSVGATVSSEATE